MKKMSKKKINASEVNLTDTSYNSIKIVETKENLGLFFENGRVYNLYRAGFRIEREDVTGELAKALKDAMK